MFGSTYWKVLTRRKLLQLGGENESKLGRVLGPFDLTALGVGATLGVGVYVLAGNVARDQAGPSVVLSFLIAAAASFLAGLCYAEFGARVPKSGSAYIYSYVCIGEFIAFIIGWNLMLEYIIGSASVSRGLSLYLDSLLNNTMKNHFEEIAPIRWDFLSNYFDFFAFGIALVLGVALAFGLKKSTIINNIFTVLNIFIVLFVIIAGSIKADTANWRINATDIPSEFNAGTGGFFPFGFEGTLKGAATCFFGFVGFDCIATTGEEVRNPQKAIPRAILYSLFIIFLAYFGVSTVLTLMWPYYLQDVNAPLPFVFNAIGWTFAKWIVSIGGIFGLIASLFGAMFPLPRIIYAMAQDGLIFRALGQVSPKFKTPVFGTLTASLLTGSMAGLFDLRSLVNMLSIGTLLAYTVVAISILILRFSDHLDEKYIGSADEESSNLVKMGNRITSSNFCLQIFNFNRTKRPTTVSKTVIAVLVLLYCMVSFCLSITIQYAKDDMREKSSWALTLGIFFTVLLLLLVLAMSLQPREHAVATFKVPLVPLLPAISIFVNIYLMLMLDMYTWIRFSIWMLIGVPIYIACIILEGGKSVRNDESQGGLNDVMSIKKSYPAKAVTTDVGSDLQIMGLSEGKLENGLLHGRAFNSPSETAPNGLGATTTVPAVLPGIPLKSDEQQANTSDEEKRQSSSSSAHIFLQSSKSSVDANEAAVAAKKGDNVPVIAEVDSNNNIKYIDKVEASLSDEIETNSVFEMLDSVLNAEGSVSPISRRNSADSMTSFELIENSTIAQIHQEYQLDNKIERRASMSSVQNNNNSSSVLFSLPRGDQFGENNKSESNDALDLLVDDRAQYKKFGSLRQQEFLSKLNVMIGQRTQENQIKPLPKSVNLTLAPAPDQGETFTPGIVKQAKNALTTSRSASNMQSLVDDSRKDSDLSAQSKDKTKTESSEEDVTSNIPAAPVFNPELFNTISRRRKNNELEFIDSSTADVSKSNANMFSVSNRKHSLESSNIPIAPAFNPVLYNTVGLQKSSRSPKAAIKNKPKDPAAAVEVVADEKGDDAGAESKPKTSDDNSITTIKDKLEQIFKRGPTNRWSFRPLAKKPAIETTEAIASSLNTDNSEIKLDNLKEETVKVTDD